MVHLIVEWAVGFDPFRFGERLSYTPLLLAVAPSASSTSSPSKISNFHSFCEGPAYMRYCYRLNILIHFASSIWTPLKQQSASCASDYHSSCIF